MDTKKCRKLDELPVVESEMKCTVCPLCGFLYDGTKCRNPSNVCPYDGKQVPVKIDLNPEGVKRVYLEERK